MSKSGSKDIAQALVEISKVLPPEDRAAACDAALKLLEKTRDNDLRSFPGRVLAALEAQDGILFASVTTPTGSLGDQRASLQASLEKAFGRPVQIEELADPALIGGLVLRIGDELFDASVRGGIEAMTLALLLPLTETR